MNKPVASNLTCNENFIRSHSKFDTACFLTKCCSSDNRIGTRPCSTLSTLVHAIGFVGNQLLHACKDSLICKQSVIVMCVCAQLIYPVCHRCGVVHYWMVQVLSDQQQLRYHCLWARRCGARDNRPRTRLLQTKQGIVVSVNPD